MAARREKTGGQEGLRSATFRSGRPENRRLRGVAFAAKLAKVDKIAKMAKVAKIAKEAKAAKEAQAGEKTARVSRQGRR